MRLLGEVRDYQSHLRYTEIDIVQCFEMALAIERYNMFCVFAHDIRLLLNLDHAKYDDVPDPRR